MKIIIFIIIACTLFVAWSLCIVGASADEQLEMIYAKDLEKKEQREKLSRGRDRKQVKLDSQQHYKELEESHDAKASGRFHTPAAYQSYSVEDYLRKMGVDIKEVTGDE